MKEQTPITAEDFLNTKKVLPYQDKFTEGHTLEIMEQYAQAKVLEALEREVPKAHFSGSEMVCRNASIPINEKDRYFLKMDAEQYYETEVKPKYKQDE